MLKLSRLTGLDNIWRDGQERKIKLFLHSAFKLFLLCVRCVGFHQHLIIHLKCCFVNLVFPLDPPKSFPHFNTSLFGTSKERLWYSVKNAITVTRRLLEFKSFYSPASALALSEAHINGEYTPRRSFEFELRTTFKIMSLRATGSLLHSNQPRSGCLCLHQFSWEFKMVHKHTQTCQKRWLNEIIWPRPRSHLPMGTRSHKPLGT